jgi:hypothetical protein
MTRLDRIKNAIDTDSDELLTDGERQEKLQLMACMTLLLEPQRTLSGIVSVLMGEHGIRERTAYNRIRDAKFVFADMLGGNDRVFAKFKARQRAEQLYKMSTKRGNVVAALAANAQLIKIDGLDKEDASAIDPTKLEPSQYRLQVPKDTIRMVRGLLTSGSVDLAELFKDSPLVQDAEFVEVKPAKGQEEEEEEAEAED